MQRYFSFGLGALTVGGLLLAIGGALYIATWVTPFSAEVLGNGFIVAATVRLMAVIALTIGLSAWCARQAPRAGTWGLVALVGCVAWATLYAGTVFTDLFVSGALAHADPGLVDGTASNDRMSLGFLISFATVVFLILLGGVTVRARVFPRAAGWLLVAAGVLALIPLPVDVPMSDLELGILLTAVGIVARRVTPLPALREPASELAGSGAGKG